MSETYSNDVRSDLDWDKIGDMRRGGAPNSPSPSSDAESQRSSSATRQSQEPVIADSQQKLAQDMAEVEITDEVNMTEPVPEVASGSQEPQAVPKQSDSAHASKSEDRVTIQAPKAAQTETAPNPKSKAAPNEPGEEEGMDVEYDEEAIAAEPQRIALLKKQHREAGRPMCTELLPDGSECGGYHAVELHDQDKAVEAKRIREAVGILRDERPDALASNKAKKVKATKEKHKDKKQALRLQAQEDKKSSAAAAKGNPKQSTTETSESRTDPKAGTSKTVLPPGGYCPTCNKRHPGKCRMCSKCGGYGHPVEKCRLKGAKTGIAGPKPAANQQQQAKPNTQAMSREEVLQHASQNVRSPAGLNSFTTLMNAGDRPAKTPAKQKPQTYAAAAKDSTTPGR